jgi:hypothetical protein
VEQLVKRLSLCDEFILFQRSHEPKDTYIRYLSGMNVAKQVQVYNWHIYVLPTLRAFTNSIPYFLKPGTHSEKIDKIFHQPQHIFRRNDAAHSDPLHSRIDILEPLYTPASRLYSALTNLLITAHHELVDLSVASSHFLRQASILGSKATGYTTSHLQTIENRIRTEYMALDISVVRTAVSKFISMLGQLLEDTKYQQSHLFHSNIEQAFKLFESKILLHHNYIKSYKRHLKLFRTIIAARFLIDHDYVTPDSLINLFLSFNLLQTITSSIKERTHTPFINLIEKNAEKLVSEMYVCQKIRELFSIKPGMSFIYQDPLSKIKKSNCPRSFFIRYTHSTRATGPARNLLQIALNLYQLKRDDDTGFNADEALGTEFADKVRRNRYLRDRMDFYRTILSREEFISLTNQCAHVFNSLDYILQIIAPSDLLAVLAPTKIHFVDKTPHEFSLSEIIAEYLNDHAHFDYQTAFKMRIDTERNDQKQDMTIIIAE